MADKTRGEGRAVLRGAWRGNRLFHWFYERFAVELELHNAAIETTIEDEASSWAEGQGRNWSILDVNGRHGVQCCKLWSRVKYANVM